MPPLIYTAEAYDEDDRFRDRLWTCAHEHRTVEEAVHCGEAWLVSQDDDTEGLDETA